MIETNNILSNPSGPEYQFLVGEGKFYHTTQPHCWVGPDSLCQCCTC
jgi:hypothetical protein